MAASVLSYLFVKSNVFGGLLVKVMDNISSFYERKMSQENYDKLADNGGSPWMPNN